MSTSFRLISGIRWVMPTLVGMLAIALLGEPSSTAADFPKNPKLAAKIAAMKAAAEKAAAKNAPANPQAAKGAGKGKKGMDMAGMRESMDLIRSSPQRTVKIAPVDAGSAARVIATAAKIDAFVEKNQEKYGVKPNAPLTDELFVRRVYLDIAGTIPTLDQSRAALAAKSDPTWRAKLIDRLLNTESHAGRMFNYWGDILRISDERMLKAVTAAPYNEWVRESIEQNKPYDKFVYEMLAATGKALENPATGYIVRDANMPLDALNNTVRVFLGTQIGCAQCHDHPFDRWTQKEFYQMAAYTYATSYQPQSRYEKMDLGKTMMALKSADPDFRAARYRPILQGNVIAIADGDKRLKYPDGIDGTVVKAGETVVPAAIFDKPALHASPGEPLRIAFARWLTSPENPRFAKTIANRYWKLAFGVGQIEPVDDMKDETVAENPELMEFLTATMVAEKFDLKQFLRILYNTKTYQREASHGEIDPTVYHFPGPALRRMSAEQVWDSFVTLAAFDDPGKYHKPAAKGETDLLMVSLGKTPPEEIVKKMQQYQAYSSKRADKFRTADYEYKGLALVRAAELATPLPPGHFLRQFGQSDREQIEGSNTDGSVPQALQMFNGPITHMLLEPDSLLTKNILKEELPGERIDVIFLSVLGRKATADDRKVAADEIRKYGRAGFGNIVWALVNTPEFLFIQ